MQVQRNHAATGTDSSGSSRGGNRWRRGNDLRSAGARTITSRSGHSALFSHRQLRRGSNHRAASNIQIAQRTRRCALHTWRRRDHRRLWGLECSCVRGVHVRRGSDHGILQGRRTASLCEMGRIGRWLHHRSFHLGRKPRFLGRRSQRHIRDGQPRLFRRVGPSHNIGQGNVALQLDVGRCDDGLRADCRLRAEAK